MGGGQESYQAAVSWGNIESVLTAFLQRKTLHCSSQQLCQIFYGATDLPWQWMVILILAVLLPGRRDRGGGRYINLKIVVIGSNLMTSQNLKNLLAQAVGVPVVWHSGSRLANISGHYFYQA